jgi:hypothetical protein
MILRLFFTERVYDNEIDGMMTQFPKMHKKMIIICCLSMNGYLREGEKLFSLSNTKMQCPHIVVSQLNPIEC